MKQIAIIQAAIGIVVLVILYQLGKNFGLFKTRSQRKKAKKEDEVESKIEIDKLKAKLDILQAPFFNPDFYKDKNPSLLIPENYAVELANRIKNSWGYFSDDESKVYAAFRGLKDKSNISQIAEKYLSLTGRDLAGDITDYFNDEEAMILIGIINSLDNG